MFRFRIATAAVALAALTLAGCSAPAEPVDGEPITLTLTTLAGPSSFAAADARWGNFSGYYEAVYDTILRQEPDGTIVSGLATEWAWDDEETSLTLTLRDDVTFSDGEKFDADAAAANLERNKAGAGTEASSLATIESVEATGDNEITVSLSRRDPSLLTALTRSPGLVQSPASFDSEDAKTEPVGSGAYVLDTSRTVTDSSYVFTAVDDYWDAERVVYDTVIINVIADPTAALNVIRAGEANGVKIQALATIAEIESLGWTANLNQIDINGFFLFDRAGTTNPALAEVKVRQAINHAFDREALVEAVVAGYGEATTQMFPTTSAGYDAELDDRYPFDVKKAKQLLAEAGYPDGFTLQVTTAPVFPAALYALIQQSLGDIGITVELVEGGATFFPNLVQGKLGATYFGVEQRADWAAIDNFVAPSAPWNTFHYSTPEMDALIDTVHTGTEEESNQAIADINAYLVEEAWFAPFYRNSNAIATDPGTTVEVAKDNAYPSIFAFHPSN